MSTYSRPLPRKTLSALGVKPVQPRTTPAASQRLNWSKWHMPSLMKEEASEAALEPVLPEEPPAPTAEEIEQARQAQLAAELEQLKQQAYQEAYAKGLEDGIAAGTQQGFEQGYQQGIEKAQAVANELNQARLQQFQLMANQAHTALEHLQHDMAQGVLSLAVHVAQHVLGHELREPTGSTLATIRKVLSIHDIEDELLTFWLNPEDYAALQPDLEKLPAISRLRFLTDATLSPGDVRAKTPHGDIDARLLTRWRSAIAALGHEE